MPPKMEQLEQPYFLASPSHAHSVILNLTYTETVAKIPTATFCQGDLRQINCFKVCKLERYRRRMIRSHLIN